ncbi:MAG: acyl-CoA reductase-like NAD-dependent aldehyde dehydrogenase [Planctomycetota bacterium]|jgi:acyl-CoA reductase-like NAD-dependent aldehyde dehydrogenase
MRWIEHHNWLGGEELASASGAQYERKAPDGSVVGAWPRSAASDAATALRAAGPAQHEWSAMRASSRRRILREAARAIASRPDPEGLIALTLGLGARKLAPHALGLEGMWMKACEEEPASFAEDSICVFRPHWTELFAGVGTLLMPLLIAGRAVIWIADPTLPSLADRFAGALYEAGLPSGTLQVLHDDGWTCLNAALRTRVSVDLVGAGGPALQARLAEACDPEHAAQADAPAMMGGGSANQPFGAGIVPLERRALHFRMQVTRSVWVGASDSADEHARRIARAAFDPSETLAGQLPGCVGRVTIDPACFSAFTEALLECLEDPDGSYQQLPAPFEVTLERELASAVELGLAEGATLIWEGHSLAGGSKNASSSPTMVSEPMGPIVFTNVESNMRIASWNQPAPLLLLMRAERTGDEPPAT